MSDFGVFLGCLAVAAVVLKLLFPDI